MEYKINGCKPEKLFNFFEIISAIPRGSGNEKGIADYIEDFAAKRGLFCYRDSLNNVFIRKNASEGYEQKAPIMLQGHTDMVCEQNSGTNHDFQTQGLDLHIENGWLKANGTTLGADDGVAVAAMLTVLDDSSLKHPELECLFTTGEETGLFGAIGFDYSMVKSKRLINLDSESEGIATVSCAGGIGLDFTLKPKRLPLVRIARPLSVSISGLAGGHSGEDIKYERGNADLLMVKLLDFLYQTIPFNLVTINGGSRGNAIPRECEAVILVSEPERATQMMVDYAEQIISAWLPKADSKFKLRVKKAKNIYDTMLSFADTSKLLSLVSLMPNGVISRIPSELNMVETSNNLGIIKDNGDDGILVLYHGRSSVNSKIDLLERQAVIAAKALGFELDVNGKYSGWAKNENSELAKDFLKIAEEIVGHGEIAAIHAGLECGIICGGVKGLDAISIGPDMKDIHTPTESLDLKSFERMYEIVKRLIAL